MSLPHALLGLLNYRPATGYELKATFTNSIHFFWDATLPQIYRTLKQMEGSGWLKVTVEHQDGKPSRKVYHVTDAGRKELQRWLSEPLEMPEPRSAMLIKVFFGNQMDSTQFGTQLEEIQKYHANLLERYEKEIIPVIERYAEATGAFRDARYWNLTLDFGRRRAKMVRDWCKAALSSLDQPKTGKGQKIFAKEGGRQRKKMKEVNLMKLKAILFVTSFVPVIVFKVVARVGDATLAQAKVATVLGLILAGTQFVLSKRLIKHTTYLEKTFLGFLALGTAWVYLTPIHVSSLFVDHSTTLLYFALFLTTFIPQLFGYDPFTYAIAKQMTPERVWNTPHFRTINLHLTYFWSMIFFVNFISSWLGHGKPLFSIVIPFIIILGIGLPVVKIYPKYYLRRQFTSQPIDPSLIPDTAKELISRMPMGFRPEAAGDLKAEIQFDLSGEGGVKGVLSIAEGKCSFREGTSSSPTLTIRSPTDVWLKIARQEINRAQALMDGLYEVEGDMNFLMKMGDLFRPPVKMREEELTQKGDTKMKILAIQGSPRPKTSNTEILLQEFLKGAQSQGAEAETIYLKEKEIHSCIGCYTCWAKTPGLCVFKDDMPELLEKVKGCDILVYATPLYNFNVTALVKAFQERLLPLLDPHLIKTGEAYRHPQRYAVNRKMVLISTCGFPEVSHFDALRQVFRHLERNGGVPIIGELLMPGGELLKQQGMQENVQGVLQTAYRAGVEVIKEGRVLKETEMEIQKPLIPPDALAEMANLWWDSHLEGITQGKPVQGKVEDMRLLLRGMAATFNSQAAGDLKATIQFEVTGRQTGDWFLSIDIGKCTYREGKASSPDLTIKTPSEIWLAIANKEMDGQQAFMEGKYTATGDISLLMRMKTLFGSGTS